jgi:hypothetical protein
MIVCTERPVVGDVGFQIFINTGLDLSTANDVIIYVEKPSGAADSWVAEAYTLDGAYGARYITLGGDLDESGNWRLQVGVDMPGFTGRGQIAVMKVIEAL